MSPRRATEAIDSAAAAAAVASDERSSLDGWLALRGWAGAINRRRPCIKASDDDGDSVWRRSIIVQDCRQVLFLYGQLVVILLLVTLPDQLARVRRAVTLASHNR